MSRLPHRWCLHRLKRILLLLCFLAVVVVISCSGFIFLNSDPLSGARLAQAWPGSGPSKIVRGDNEVAGGSGPLMVQFYPDNQNKYLYRKDGGDSAAGTHYQGTGAKRKPNYEEVVREKLAAVSDSARGHGSNLSYDTVLTNDVHLFYYAWYGNPEHDSRYYHWNHEYMKNWDKNDRKTYPTGVHDPTLNDIGSNYYPQLGAYSSADPAVIAAHMKQAKMTGAGVLVVSWYPPGLADEHGPKTDPAIPALLEAAGKEGLKIALLVEPYQDMNVTNLRANLAYVRKTYFDHPAFYKRRVGNRELPMYYLYDSYRILYDQWQRLLSRKGDLSVRGTDLDGIFIGLLVEFRHRVDIKKGKFDGFFTYFAANGFCHGSSWKNWKGLQDYAIRNSLLFVPSVGPGYVDVRLRPWNGQTTRERRRGSYYGMAWRTALNAGPKVVSVTSFNEWHEGTQIEPAVPMASKEKRPFSYQSYEPEDPEFYLRETRHWISEFVKKK